MHPDVPAGEHSSLSSILSEQVDEEQRYQDQFADSKPAYQALPRYFGGERVAVVLGRALTQQGERQIVLAAPRKVLLLVVPDLYSLLGLQVLNTPQVIDEKAASR